MTQLLALDTAAANFRPGPLTQEEGAAMFRAALNLFAKWQLTDEQASALLDLNLRTYRRWKAEGCARLDRDTMARLSNLMGIHKALRIIFREPQRSYDWVRAPNTAFANRSALAVMLDGELTDLMRVRRYLDAERGGW
jgi:hypothetical protein